MEVAMFSRDAVAQALVQRVVAVLTVALLALAATAAFAATAGAQVLRVGTYKGVAGQYTSIQAAVDAAQPGDWVLVAPGDYHEQADHRANRGPQPADHAAGVVISTPGITLRGLDRNGVVVDGTKPGAPQCSANPADQDLGPTDSSGNQTGRNGILIWKANNVSVENLTACNFQGGSGAAGNQIWWNGGDGSGQNGLSNFYGSYLNATSTYYKDESTAATYGIFSSNSSGGTWDYTYTSNMNDSGYYIGACAQACDQTLDHGQGEFNALGYSGTNSGGQVIVQNSEFDNNEDGFDTNSQNNSDWPSPQDGACPNGGMSAITHTNSCWVFMHNYVHDNNNPDVPSSGSAAAGPVGTGMSIAGGRNDTVMANRFVNNKAWGVVFVPYPDTETPPSNATPCVGGTNGGGVCNYDDWGNALIGNTFTNNGGYGNDTNGDFAELTTTAGPSNCYSGNVDTGGTLTSSPSGLQQSKPTCGGTVPPDSNPSFTSQIVCDSQLVATPCAPNENYPRRTTVVMHPLPSGLASMPDPCAGVPSNPWCMHAVTTCVKSATLRLSTGARERIVRVRVAIAGRRAKVVSGSKLRGRHPSLRLDLRGLRGATVRVTITETLKIGRRMRTVRILRVYPTCARH
jgi:hypothetical protein